VTTALAIVRLREVAGPGREPCALVARGESARIAARRALGRVGLVAVSFEGGIAVAGEASALPWVEGAVWLARDPRAPSLLVPSRSVLEPDGALVERALARAGFGSPLALVPDGDGILAISLAAARRPGRAEVEAFVSRAT
jgi:hypothetical protein